MDAGQAHSVDAALKSWEKRGGKGIPPVILGALMVPISLLTLISLAVLLKRLGVLESVTDPLPSVPNGYMFAAIAIILVAGPWMLRKMFIACKNN